MKKQMIILLLGTGLLVLTACGSDTVEQDSAVKPAGAVTATETSADASADNPENTEEEQNSEISTTETEGGSETETEDSGSDEEAASTEMPELYQEVLDTYRKAIQKEWDTTDLAERELSVRLANYYGESAEDNLGCWLVDLDDDGVREMLIATTTGDDAQILDGYTIVNGTAAHIFSADETTAYYVKADHTIACIQEDGSFSCEFIHYELEGDFLYNALELSYNEELDADAPWFTVDAENYDPISESEFEELVQQLQSDYLMPEAEPLSSLEK